MEKKLWGFGTIALIVGLIIGGLTATLMATPMKMEAIRSALFIFDVEKNEWRALTTDDLGALKVRGN